MIRAFDLTDRLSVVAVLCLAGLLVVFIICICGIGQDIREARMERSGDPARVEVEYGR